MEAVDVEINKKKEVSRKVGARQRKEFLSCLSYPLGKQGWLWVPYEHGRAP